MIVNATSLDDIRIEVLGEARAHTFQAMAILKYTQVAGRLVALCRELDEELDGVKIPASAAAVCNGIRDVLNQIDDE